MPDKLNQKTTPRHEQGFIAKYIVPSIAWLIANGIIIGIMYLTVIPLGAYLGSEMDFGFITQSSSGQVLNLNWILFIRVVSIIPTVAVILIMRFTTWRRGMSDTIAAAFFYGLSSLVIMSASGSFHIELFLYAVTLGALGGFIYWICAGRPRPPY